MRTILAFGAFLAGCVCAQAAPAPQPPPGTPTCIDTRHSADYTAGVDARGKPVVPADVPTQGNIEVSTEVFAEVKTNNPQVPSVGVDVNLKALNPLPACPTRPRSVSNKPAR